MRQRSITRSMHKKMGPLPVELAKVVYIISLNKAAPSHKRERLFLHSGFNFTV